jgi:predicted dehydrogenase
MPSDKVTVAVAGLGRIASTLEKDALRGKPCTHIGAVAVHPECSLVAGCDIDGEARERFMEDWGAFDPPSKVFDSAAAMLSEVRPDIMIVATYPDSHYPMCARAAAAGVPVVICEKPLADTLRDAKKIAASHRQGKTKILVNHERRYSADYIGVKDAVDSRLYGDLLSVKAVLYFGKSTPLKKMLLHDGTHMVDIINYLCPAPLRMSRLPGPLNRTGRNTVFLFGTAGGVAVLLEAGAGRDHLVFEVELSFERGRIRVGNGVLEYEGSAESPYYEGYRSLRQDTKPEIQKTGYFYNMIDDAVRCVREPKRMPLSSAEDALEVMKFIRSVRACR